MTRFPDDVFQEFHPAGNLFASSIFAFVSAMVKLSRIETFEPGTKMYRGMGGRVQLPDCFFFGELCYVDNGLFSCTTNFQVALQYSGAREERPLPAVLVIECGAVDRPCQKHEFSQCDVSSVRRRLLLFAVLMICRYPEDDDFIFPPFSVVQPSGHSWEELHYGCAVTM